MDSNTIINRKISNAGPLLPLYIPIIFTVLATAAASFLLFKYTDKTRIYTVFYNLDCLQFTVKYFHISWQTRILYIILM